MSGFRAYFEDLKSAAEGADIVLSGDESRHLCGALRARAGDEVDVFNLSGERARAKISVSDSRAAKLCILKKFSAKPNTSELILAQALPKGKAFDDIIALCVQLGVSKICPVLAERCVVRLDAAEGLKKLAKWRQQLVEAVKQSANLSPVEILAPMSFSEFLEYARSFESKKISKFIASLDAENPKPLLSALKLATSDTRGACVFVGCEGDFTKNEYRAAYAENFEPVSLGENVLKSDIAAAFSMSVCSAFFADGRGGD